MNGPVRILVVNPFGLGDVIFSMALVEALRAARPGIVIGFLCNERTVDLVRLNTSIDRTYVFNRDRYRRLWRKNPFLFWRKLAALLGQLKEEHYDVMLDLSLGRQYAFFAAMIGIRSRVGFDYKGRGFFLTKKLPLTGYRDRHVADAQLELLALLGVKDPARISRLPLRLSSEAVRGAALFLKNNGIGSEDAYFVVAPGGGKTWGKNAVYKQWAPERFAAASTEIARRKRLKVLVAGDLEEALLLDSVARGISGTGSAVAAGLPIDLVAALLSRARFFLGNDGGLLHLANALGVKNVSFYGPVDEKAYGPYGTETPHEVVTAAVECRPCYRDFRFPPCPYDRRCLNEISVEKAVEIAEKIA